MSDLSSTLDSLQGMRERWRIYAVTREAFVYLVANRLDTPIAGNPSRDVGRALEMKCLGIPGTCAVDEESCLTRLDEAFANKVIDEAVKLLGI